MSIIIVSSILQDAYHLIPDAVHSSFQKPRKGNLLYLCAFVVPFPSDFDLDNFTYSLIMQMKKGKMLVGYTPRLGLLMNRRPALSSHVPGR